MIELTKVVGQADPVLAGLLNKIRFGKVDNDVIPLLETRIVSDDAIISVALYVFSTNHKVSEMNETMLVALPGESVVFDTINIKRDRQTGMICDVTLSDNYHDTGNLVSSLRLKTGARLQLTQNLSVEGGLANGALGKVVAIHQIENKYCVLEKFDNASVGTRAKATSPFKDTHPDAVPINHFVNLILHKKKTTYNGNLEDAVLTNFSLGYYST